MPGQHRRDLPGLHPEPADLDLLISAPGEHQLPALPAGQVPGPVHPAPGRAERARHKPARRQPRTIQVTARQTRPRHIQLPRHPVRHQPQPAIKHEHPGVIHRTPDRHRPRPRPRHRITRGERRGLRRPVPIDHAVPGHSASTRATAAADGSSPPVHTCPAAGQAARRRRGHQVEQRRRQPQPGHRLRRHHRRQARHIQLPRRRQHRRPPGQQRHPQLISHRIKDLRRMHQHPLMTTPPPPVTRQPRHPALSDHHALGRPRRPRGIHHIRRPARPHPHRARNCPAQPRPPCQGRPG